MGNHGKYLPIFTRAYFQNKLILQWVSIFHILVNRRRYLLIFTGDVPVYCIFQYKLFLQWVSIFHILVNRRRYLLIFTGDVYTAYFSTNRSFFNFSAREGLYLFYFLTHTQITYKIENITRKEKKGLAMSVYFPYSG